MHRFNSKLVRLKVKEIAPFITDDKVCFNSKLVRLKAHQNSSITKPYTKFQFQIGAIKR